MPLDKYNDYLLFEIKKMVFWEALLLILAIVFFIFLFHAIKKKDADGIVAHSIILTIVIGITIGVVIYTVPYILDVEEGAYVKYEGEFWAENTEFDLRAGSQPYLKFPGEENHVKYKLRGGVYLSDGKHTGYVIYSKRSKMIVEWNCTECIDETQ